MEVAVILKEITKWDKVGYNVHNHSYALDNQGRLVAYRVTGTKTWQVFSKPKPFSRSYRKFITLEKGEIKL